MCETRRLSLQSVNLYAVTVIVLGLNMELRVKIYHAFAWGKVHKLDSLCFELSLSAHFLVCHFLGALAWQLTAFLKTRHHENIAGIPAVITALSVGIAGINDYGDETL